MKKLLALILMGMFFSVGAQAGAMVNVLGGMNYQNDSVSPSSGNTTSAVGGLTYGATVEFGVTPMMDLELGALSVGDKTKFSSAGGDYTVSARAIAIPLMLRFTALPVLDFGVGAYYAMLPNKVTVENSTNPSATNGDVATTATGDYGLRAGVRAKLPLAVMTKFLVDISYNFGLKDTDSSSSTEKTRSYSILGGLSFGF